MSDLLDETALGDETRILPSTALGQSALSGDAGAPSRIPVKWRSEFLAIHVTSSQSPVLGYATPSTSTLLGDTGHLEFFCKNPATFTITVRFYVDAEEIPRPPAAAPLCRLSWKFAPDDNGRLQNDAWEDRAPKLGGAGSPLSTTFPSTVRITSSKDGTLTLNAQLIDNEGTVNYRDEIRCVITPCS